MEGVLYLRDDGTLGVRGTNRILAWKNALMRPARGSTAPEDR